MVAKVHPSTLKAAQQKGFDIVGEPEDEVYTIHWREGKKKLVNVDAKAGVADMALWKMLTLEYPKIKVTFADDGTVTLKQGPKTILAEGFVSITEAWNAHLDSAAEADAANRAEGGGGTDENGESKSIVRRKYREAYKSSDHTNGDDTADKLKSYLYANGQLDRDKMVRFAQKNDLWDDKYDRLNNGQVRMNIGNKLRKKVAQGYAPVWVK